MAETAVLSVRGEASRMIAPDYVQLQCGLGATAGSKADALALIRSTQQRLGGSLAELGGVVITVEAYRSPLTWSVGSVGTHEEHDFNKATGQHGPTGRVVANAAVIITVRDMALLTEVAAALAAVDGLHVAAVSWHVDEDNAAWREVRADAIAAAIVKGHDYAAALGGTVTRVEHVADAGLLADGEPKMPVRAVALGFAGAVHGGGEPTDTPSLDPIPQQIHAVVEARLIAEVAPLRKQPS